MDDPARVCFGKRVGHLWAVETAALVAGGIACVEALARSASKDETEARVKTAAEGVRRAAAILASKPGPSG